MRWLILVSIVLLRKCGLFQSATPTPVPSIFAMHSAVSGMFLGTSESVVTIIDEFMTWCPNQHCHSCSAKLPINSWIYALSDGTSACERCKPAEIHWAS